MLNRRVQRLAILLKHALVSTQLSMQSFMSWLWLFVLLLRALAANWCDKGTPSLGLDAVGAGLVSVAFDLALPTDQT
jgi:O-antigen ligase